jgi:hypothetical protein
MKSIRHRVATLLGTLALAATGHAANVQDVVRDTQRTSLEDGRISLVWWIPVQFWDESLKSTPGVPEAMRTQITSVMGEYNIVALLRATTGAGGIEGIQPKDELVKNTRVEIGGKVVEPLAAEQIAPAAAALLSQLKPVLMATIGQMGQGMEFVVYPGKVDGKLLVDAAQPGSLAITFYGKKYQWRLPLGALLPAKADRKTGEDFPGNYLYNPFTGDKLDAK